MWVRRGEFWGEREVGYDKFPEKGVIGAVAPTLNNRYKSLKIYIKKLAH